MGTIYKHPDLKEKEFTEDFLSDVFKKLSKEKREVILTGDFNIDLLKYNECDKIQNFANSIFSNSLQPHIFSPTRITHTSNTLIDNIYSNLINYDIVAGNVTLKISDHFPQFMFMYGKSSLETEKTQSDKIFRDFSDFDQKNFSQILSNKNWKNELEIDKNDVNNSLDKFNNILNSLIEEHIPIKTRKTKKAHIKRKHWVTQGLVNSIERKNKLYKKYCKVKNEKIKSRLIKERKELKKRNISTLVPK